MPDLNDVEIGDTVDVFFNYGMILKNVMVIKVGTPNEPHWIFRAENGDLYKECEGHRRDCERNPGCAQAVQRFLRAHSREAKPASH